MLAPPQARRSGPGGQRPRKGRQHGQQCLPCEGSRAECEAKTIFFWRQPISNCCRGSLPMMIPNVSDLKVDQLTLNRATWSRQMHLGSVAGHRDGKAQNQSAQILVA